MPAAVGGVPPFNAVVLAGGRSSRLGGTPKAQLQASGRTLLATTLAAASDASACAVAGPPELAAAVSAAAAAARSPVLLVREDPPFAGPAAAVAAALAALADQDGAAGRAGPEWTLVLACDMPFVAQAVAVLLAEAAADTPAADRPDGFLARDESGTAQPLAGLYRTVRLTDAVVAADRHGGLENLSMRALLARVQWRDVAVPAHSTADIDTWDDARRWSIGTGAAEGREEPAASD